MLPNIAFLISSECHVLSERNLFNARAGGQAKLLSLCPIFLFAIFVSLVCLLVYCVCAALLTLLPINFN